MDLAAKPGNKDAIGDRRGTPANKRITDQHEERCRRDYESEGQIRQDMAEHFPLPQGITEALEAGEDAREENADTERTAVHDRVMRTLEWYLTKLGAPRSKCKRRKGWQGTGTSPGVQMSMARQTPETT